MKIIVAILSVISLQTCISNSPSLNHKDPIWEPSQINQDGLKKAYFASGCFWCVEAIYESVKG